MEQDAMYKEWLEHLRVSSPEDYLQLMQELGVAQNDGEFEPTLPGGEKSMGQSGILDKDPGMEVTPSPSFVIKTLDLTSKTKVFVNICTSTSVAKPAMRKRLKEDGEEEEGLNVPLSLGEAFWDKDKKGGSCQTFDLIVHPEVLNGDSAGEHQLERHFLCELAIDHVENKNKIRLDRRYKLPRLVYKGPVNPSTKEFMVRPQRIRAKARPQIEEVQNVPSTKDTKRTVTGAAKGEPAPKKDKDARENSSKGTMQLTRAPCSLFELKGGKKSLCHRRPACEGGPALSEKDFECLPLELHMVIQLDKLQSAGQCRLQMSKQRIKISFAQLYQDIDTILPFPIVVEETSAEWNSSAHSLEVIMMVDRSFDVDGPDEGSGPWLLKQALAREENSPSQLNPQKESGNTQSSIKPLKDQKLASDFGNDGDEDEMLPEDYFHQKDPMSRFILDQRKKEAEEKRRKSRDREIESPRSFADLSLDATTAQTNDQAGAGPRLRGSAAHQQDCSSHLINKNASEVVRSWLGKVAPRKATDDPVHKSDPVTDLDDSLAFDLL